MPPLSVTSAATSAAARTQESTAKTQSLRHNGHDDNLAQELQLRNRKTMGICLSTTGTAKTMSMNCNRGTKNWATRKFLLPLRIVILVACFTCFAEMDFPDNNSCFQASTWHTVREGSDYVGTAHGRLMGSYVHIRADWTTCNSLSVSFKAVSS